MVQVASVQQGDKPFLTLAFDAVLSYLSNNDILRRRDKSMDVFTMVVIIVIVGCVTGMVTTWLETQAKKAESGASSVEIERMHSEIQALRDRVRVLEKLATDEDTRLREQIARLA